MQDPLVSTLRKATLSRLVAKPSETPECDVDIAYVWSCLQHAETTLGVSESTVMPPPPQVLQVFGGLGMGVRNQGFLNCPLNPKP